MLKLAELKQIDVVVCYKIDRIARNTLDFLNILEMFKENNVELISITEGFDPNTQMGKVMLTLLASFAEMERSNIQQRVKDNLLSIAKKVNGRVALLLQDLKTIQMVVLNGIIKI